MNKPELEEVTRIVNAYNILVNEFNCTELFQGMPIENLTMAEVLKNMNKDIEKDCWNCECTRLDKKDEPCASCKKYSNWKDDFRMHEDNTIKPVKTYSSVINSEINDEVCDSCNHSYYEGNTHEKLMCELKQARVSETDLCQDYE